MIHNLFQGMPVLVMRKGHWPNQRDIEQVQQAWPDHEVKIETQHFPCTRFCITVRHR